MPDLAANEAGSSLTFPTGARRWSVRSCSSGSGWGLALAAWAGSGWGLALAAWACLAGIPFLACFATHLAWLSGASAAQEVHPVLLIGGGLAACTLSRLRLELRRVAEGGDGAGG